MFDKNNPIFNVNSNYQSGGITAGIVNIYEKPQRTIGEDQINLIKQYAPQSKKILIDSVMGDQESLTVVLNLQNRLQQDGYQVMTSQSAYVGIPRTQMNVGSDPLEIIIGPNQ